MNRFLILCLFLCLCISCTKNQCTPEVDRTDVQYIENTSTPKILSFTAEIYRPLSIEKCIIHYPDYDKESTQLTNRNWEIKITNLVLNTVTPIERIDVKGIVIQKHTKTVIGTGWNPTGVYPKPGMKFTSYSHSNDYFYCSKEIWVDHYYFYDPDAHYWYLDHDYENVVDNWSGQFDAPTEPEQGIVLPEDELLEIEVEHIVVYFIDGTSAYWTRQQ